MQELDQMTPKLSRKQVTIVRSRRARLCPTPGDLIADLSNVDYGCNSS
jgi:hypothetical protein